MERSEIENLIDAAIEATHNSYSPYSNYSVGAALLTIDGKLFTGCNIENATYGATNCAERTAIFKAISEGEKQFKAIAVNGIDSQGEADYAFPCGICRQVLAEFCEPDFIVICAKNKDDFKRYTIGELLPEAFSL